MTLVLLETQIASADSVIDFVSSIDSTYDIYEIHITNAHPAGADQEFQVQANAVGASGFNETVTSIFTNSYHNESGSSTDWTSSAGDSQGNGTAYQTMAQNVGDDADQSVSGILRIINPSSTTFATHCQYEGVHSQHNDYVMHIKLAMYFNITAAIDEFSFKFDGANIATGTFKLFGVGE